MTGSLSLTFPGPTPTQPAKKSRKLGCQVGGVGDRHTTFLGPDTDSDTAPELRASQRINSSGDF